MTTAQILQKEQLTKEDILQLLKSKDQEKELLFSRSRQIKQEQVGKKLYLRGLIELSNICRKDCLYCGIRQNNPDVHRYRISEEDFRKTVRYAVQNKLGSLVLQSGEVNSSTFQKQIIDYLTIIRKESKDEMRVTLSLGEQSEETYRKWFMAGAHRYLLRIETSSPQLYKFLHPENHLHNFETRKACLKTLSAIGYQTGTGVMIGLPFQTLEDLADDLLFFKEYNIDMIGMGPYIEHPDTPLYQHRQKLLPIQERFDLTLKMIAILRILMRDVNIAATTALQAIDKLGREKAIRVGANVWMPNITPSQYRGNYLLYPNKPCIDEHADDCLPCLDARVQLTGDTIAWDEKGDSLHFQRRKRIKI